METVQGAPQKTPQETAGAEYRAVQKGWVKFFNGNPGKEFGILLTDTGEVFFHAGNYRPVAPRKNGTVRFCADEGRPERTPMTGDCIMFLSQQREQGPKATAWAFVEEYNTAYIEAQELLEVESIVYRVIERFDIGVPPNVVAGEVEVKFIGVIRDLNNAFPRPENERFDELHGRMILCDVEHHIHFERQSATTWIRCPDPRPILSEYAFRAVKRRGNE